MLGDAYIDLLSESGGCSTMSVCAPVSENITSVESNLGENFKLDLLDKVKFF